MIISNLTLDDVIRYTQSQPLAHVKWLEEAALVQCFDQLDQHGVAIFDDCYPLNNMDQLRQECLSHQLQFKQAEIQNGRMRSIRSDHILWIDDTLAFAQQHIFYLLQFAKTLNQAFYLGLYEAEAHFAHYHCGEFYSVHRDNPQGKNGRVISTVYYLHEHWQDGDGGELRVQNKQGEWQIIQPLPNRLAVFQSDLLHEVLPSHKDRLSITAWLRQRT